MNRHELIVLIEEKICTYPKALLLHLITVERQNTEEE